MVLLIAVWGIEMSIKVADVGMADKQRKLNEAEEAGDDDELADLEKNDDVVLEGEEREEKIKEFKPMRDKDVTIKDIKKLSDELDELNRFLKSKILGDLQSNLLVRRMEISYRMYQLINKVRRGYEANKEHLRYMIDYIRTIVALSHEHIDENQVELTEEIMEDANALTDYYNHNILMQLFEKLNENTTQLWNSTYVELDEFMHKMKKIHHDLDMTDEDKVAELIKIAVNLTVFDNENISSTIEKIKSLQDLILNNPKYHRLAKTKDYVPPYGLRMGESRFSILLLSSFTLLFGLI